MAKLNTPFRDDPEASQDAPPDHPIDRYGRGIHQFVMACVRGRENHVDLTRDLVQEIYLRFLRVSNAEIIQFPQAYLYSIARHVVHEFKQRQLREGEVFDSDIPAEEMEKVSSSESTPEAKLLAARELEARLDQLPPLHRAIFLLRKRDHFSYEEIAQQLRISRFTVKKYLGKALAQLREADWTPNKWAKRRTL